MRKILAKYRVYVMNRIFLRSILMGMLFFIVSLIVNYNASIYALDVASNPVTDFFLDRLPLVNTELIFIEGFAIFWAFFTLLALHEPRRIPFLLKSLALFITVRAIFVSLTHIGPFPEEAKIDSNLITRAFTSGSDLFFSGHTGIPFLMALMFWEQYYLRIIFLFSSLVMGASVLLGHLHYSIDVFAAFFITYTIFVIAKKFFRKDHEVFLHGFDAT